MTGSGHQAADGHRVGSSVILPLCVEVTVYFWSLTLKLLIRRLSLSNVLFPGPFRCPLTSGDQAAQRVHSQGNQQSQHQVTQNNPSQYTRAHGRTVASWESVTLGLYGT